ncbi:MAG TPA: CHASE3 domain-containing protein [Gaiellaceae bacterium]|nr:CHASE3 domain-containing protein [Gaiellaceae bacterium]
MRSGLTLRMLLSAGALAVVIAAVFVLLLLAINDLRDSARLTRDSQQELSAADVLEKLVIDMETGVRGYVITRERRFLEPSNEARAAFPAAARSLERTVRDDAGRIGPVRQIVQEVASYIDEYASPLIRSVQRADPSASSIAVTAEGKRRVDALRSEFATLTARERAAIAARQDRADAAARRAIALGLAGFGGSILIVLLFTGYLARVIVAPLRRAAGMAGRLAHGDLGARMPETGAGEIGELERSFNTMASSLETSQEDLRRLLDEQSRLRRVATLVAQSVAPLEVFTAVTREVGLLSGADLARMERYEADGTVTGVASWSSEDDELAVGTRFALEGVSIAALVVETGSPVRIDSFAEATGPIAEEARALGIRSSVGCPIIVGGRVWGVIAASTKREAPFPVDTESRIGEFTELVATAISNSESRAELTASRARIVTAADETRRRIERDLHDGTQQRLVSLGLDLRLAQSSVPSELPELEQQIGRAARELDDVIDDLREISRGIHPAILSEGGIGPALRTLARRAPLPVEVEVPTERRLPAPIEAAAYYVVSEALTNTTKHAGASVVRVAVDDADGTLRLSIRDDGAGGADPRRGSGLTGLRDRVEALGGAIAVSSPAGQGTVLVVELPLEHEPAPSA